MFKIILLYISVATGSFDEKVYELPVDNMAACLIAAHSVEAQFRADNAGALVLIASCVADPTKFPLPTPGPAL